MVRILCASLLALSIPGAARASAKPACRVALAPATDSVNVVVRGRRLSLERMDRPPQEIRVYPFGADAVLIAWAGRSSRGPYGSSTLWKIPCKTGPAESFLHVEGADFGHSALSADGRSLLFTGREGIESIELTSRKRQRLTDPPALAHCDLNDTPRARDVVGQFLDAQTLSFERGGPCGFEAEWQAEKMLLREPGTPRVHAERAPRPPFPSVAIGADGAVWLSDGTCSDASTFGRMLVSHDCGDTWARVPVKMFSPQPVRLVIASRSNQAEVLVLGESCPSSSHVEAAWIYISEDGGKTFRSIAVPEGIEASNGQPAPELDPIATVLSPDGNVQHLILYGATGRVDAPMLDRWESHDGGRSWTSLAPARAPPPPAPRAFSANCEVTIQKDGLYRIRPDADPKRIDPPG
jgi:hypothetical protein